MKRVGNKSGQLVRSASRRNKSTSRFQFDLLVHSVQGLKPGGVYYIKWTRGIKVETSEHFTIPKDIALSAPHNLDFKLPLLVTLYREEGKRFEPKESKVSIVSVSPKKERTVAKARFDLSLLAGVPHSSTSKLLKFDEKVLMRTTVESKFLRAGAAGPGSAASSVMSGVDAGSDDDVGGDDEFGDLNIDDVPDPEFASSPALPRTTRSTSSAASSATLSSVTAPSPSAQSAGSSNAPARKAPSPTASVGKLSVPAADEGVQPRSFGSASGGGKTSSSPKGYRRRERSNIPKSGDVDGLTPSAVTASLAARAKGLSAGGVKDGSPKAVAATASLPRAGSGGGGGADGAGVAELRKQNEQLSVDLASVKRERDAKETERVQELQGLRARLERQSADLEDATKKRESMRVEHRREITELRDVVEGKTREYNDVSKRCNDATQNVADMKAKNTELRATVEELTNELATARESTRAVEIDLERGKDRETELSRSVEELKTELVNVGRQRDEMRMRVKRGETAEGKVKELSAEVDRLTVAAARSGNNFGGTHNGSDEVERRIATLQHEKSSLEGKIGRMQEHAAKVKVAYDKLNSMYTNLCDEYTSLQRELASEKKKSGDSAAAAAAAAAATAAMASTPVDAVEKDDDEKNILVEELEDVRRQLREVHAMNDSVQEELERANTHAEMLQDRLDGTTSSLSESQKEVDDLYKEMEELKGERDVAMQRVLSRGKNNNATADAEAKAAAEERLRASKERFEKEQARLARRVGELETENGDLREDVEYEKSEKLKAREERDRMRETARALERRTSQAAKASDQLHSMKRQLSTHQMKEQDNQMMISDLQQQVEALQLERDEARRLAAEPLPDGEHLQDVVQSLVTTKLALAEAKSEKQQLEFAMKKLRRNESVVQRRLGEKATRLESRLREATDELERVRKENSKDVVDGREYNELGSDVDY